VSLNPEQIKAVTTLSGPMLVLAGAGSGKTRVVTYRIRALIERGTPPSRILAVTFTNKAAREMRTRAKQLLERRRGDGPEISTLHSLCVRILRRHAERLGYPKTFSICDAGDQESIARAALRHIRVEQSTLRPGDLLSIVGGWKSKGLDPSAALESASEDREQLAALAYERYQAGLVSQGSLDFDDLLLCTEQLFTRFPEVRKEEAARFDQLMIDEYQDTNASQYRIIRGLALAHRNLCVVGDDDQSIYGWRGAEVTHILNFTNDWPEATVIRLMTNYRSREPILKLANTLVAHNKTRHPKELKAHRTGGEPPRFQRYDDENIEAQSIVREIAHKTTIESEERQHPKSFAILFRTNEQPRAFEIELRSARIPYVLIGGQSYFDRKEIRDILAYLKVLANPADEVSLLRIFNTPARGIGPTTIKALLSYAIGQGKTLWEALPAGVHELELADANAERVEAFVRMIEGYRESLASQPLSHVARRLVDELEYKKELERAYKTASEVDGRFNAIEELIRTLAEYEARAEEPSLTGFLEDTALGGRDDFKSDKQQNENAVTLMTLHSAKGLEFPHVYMVGMEEGLLPHQRSIVEGNGVDEERRLCYVGVTRAQDTLTLSLCKARMKWGKLRPSIPSRFLMEMRGETEKAQRLAQESEQQAAAMKQAEAAKLAAAEKPSPKSAARSARAGAPKAKTRSNAPVRAHADPPAAPAGPSVRARRLKPAVSRES
jgi:DNA helicase-2/ATP-dependent DNA helicase PcrA